jgi:RimJ/RimL family protein N-acetyltransferase
LPSDPEPRSRPAIVLVPLEDSHAALAHELWSDPQVVRFTNWERTTTREEASVRIARLHARYTGEPKREGPCVAMNADGRCAGLIGIDWVDREHEVWYLVPRALWGQGYGSAMLQAMLDRAASRSFGRVVATSVAINAASWRLLERTGFRRVATLVDGFRRHGVVADLHRYERSGASCARARDSLR